MNNPVKEELSAAVDLAADRALVGARDGGDYDGDVVFPNLADVSGKGSLRQAASARLGGSALPPSGPRRGSTGPRGQRMSILGDRAPSSGLLNRMSSDGRSAEGEEGEGQGYLLRGDNNSRDGSGVMGGRGEGSEGHAGWQDDAGIGGDQAAEWEEEDMEEDEEGGGGNGAMHGGGGRNKSKDGGRSSGGARRNSILGRPSGTVGGEAEASGKTGIRNAVRGAIGATPAGAKEVKAAKDRIAAAADKAEADKAWDMALSSSG